MRYVNPKHVAMDILQCAVLWYEGADPEAYGYSKDVSVIGKKLADDLFERSKIIFRRQG